MQLLLTAENLPPCHLPPEINLLLSPASVHPQPSPAKTTGYYNFPTNVIHILKTEGSLMSQCVLDCLLYKAQINT